MKKYDGWIEYPCGKMPRKWERTEKYKLQKDGYDITPRVLVETFEEKISTYIGSKYGISTNGCTSALFLSLMYLKYMGELDDGDIIEIPKRTYFSVPMTIINCGLRIKFLDIRWSGNYRLGNTKVIDSATRFSKGVYEPDSLYCVSFQYRKRIPIGRGGMILTNDEDAMKWFKRARIDGRNYGVHQWEDVVTTQGWNCYMPHDDAARGIMIFDDLMEKSDVHQDYGSWNTYPDISNQPFFKKYVKN